MNHDPQQKGRLRVATFPSFRAIFDFVDFCHSAIHASLMALAAPEVFASSWARKIFFVGAQIPSLKLTLQRYGAVIAVLESIRKFFDHCHDCHDCHLSLSVWRVVKNFI